MKPVRIFRNAKMKSQFSYQNNKIDLLQITKKNHGELKEMIETAREPEFGYPRIDNFDSEENKRGVSWDPILKDIQKAAENKD